MKIIALDVGDVHTGVAYADDTGILAAPYTTVPTRELSDFIARLCTQHALNTVIVGQPKTLAGGVSEQTKKVTVIKETLEKEFCKIKWVWWNERLTSKHAQQLVAKKIKHKQNYEHEVAAAILLQSYLDTQSALRVFGDHT